jgi:hypothetical protein
MWLKEIETACDGLAAETNTTAESLRKMAQVIASSRSTEEYLNDLSALGNASKQQGDAQESLLRGLDERQVKRHWINEEVVPKGPDKIVGVLDTRQTAARWLVTNLFIERYLREAALPDIKARRIRTHALELLQGSRTRIQLLEGA